MKKTILTFGLISGAISCVLMGALVPFADRIGFDKSTWIGYTTIVLSMLLVFFGVRSYRDNVGQGQITFGRAFGVGLAIMLISCVCYVVMWEIVYFNFMHDFLDKYNAYVLQKAQASGATPAQIQAKIAEIQKLKVMYENPLYNAAMTFMEPFPVGLIITLLSAAILRRKPAKPGASAAVVAV